MENKVTADYLDEEGCLHCGTCGKRKQMKVSLMPSMLLSVSFPRNRFKKRISLLFTSVLQLTEQ